jgi:hypothetical protein
VRDVSTKRSQYQQGSIRKVRKAKCSAWEVRFSELLNGRQFRPLAGTTKASIRTLLNNCFNLAAKYEYIPAFQQNRMYLVKIKGVSERQKEIQQITVNQFKAASLAWVDILPMQVSTWVE